MTSIPKVLSMLITTIFISSCSVQQFSVNTKVKPFENGGKVWGERTKKCGDGGWELATAKDKDILILGINVKKSNADKLVKDLQASSYTIETKSNLIVRCITFGMVDYKVVTVIKRTH